MPSTKIRFLNWVGRLRLPEGPTKIGHIWARLHAHITRRGSPRPFSPEERNDAAPTVSVPDGQDVGSPVDTLAPIATQHGVLLAGQNKPLQVVTTDGSTELSQYDGPEGSPPFSPDALQVSAGPWTGFEDKVGAAAEASHCEIDTYTATDKVHRHSRMSSSTELEPDFLTANGAMRRLAKMDFEVKLPGGKWVKVKVMLDTGVDHSFLLWPFIERYDYPHHPLQEKDIKTFTSPVVGGSRTLNRWARVIWKSEQLRRTAFKTDLYIIKDEKADPRKDDCSYVAIFGRGVLEKRGLWDLLPKWINEKDSKPIHAAPAMVVWDQKRDEATMQKDSEAWIQRQRSNEAALKDFYSAASSSSKSGEKSSEGTSTSDKNTETATTVSSDAVQEGEVSESKAKAAERSKAVGKGEQK